MLGEYVVLRKITTEDEADEWTRGGGWADHADFIRRSGDSLIGYWVDTESEEEPPKPFRKRSVIQPIAAVVHGRMYEEKAKGLRVGNKAWITEEDFERLF